jgi:hypothetical protein
MAAPEIAYGVGLRRGKVEQRAARYQVIYQLSGWL